MILSVFSVILTSGILAEQVQAVTSQKGGSYGPMLIFARQTELPA